MKSFLYFLILLVFITSFHRINLNKLNENEIQKHLEYTFNRNLTIKESFKPEDFFTTYFYNQLYINLKVGSNQLEIPFYFYLNQYPFVLQSSNVKKSEVKGIYDESKSTSYKPLNNIESFDKGDLMEGILSKDYFYFNNDKSYINFYLSKENYGYTHITVGGKIGLKQKPDYGESVKSSFINNLKENNLISSYIFTFKYDSSKIDDDSGKIYIGNYPHIFNPTQYKENYYINYKVEVGYEHPEWMYFLDTIKINNTRIDRSKIVLFYSELGFIIGTENFFEYLNKSKIWNEYLYVNKKCHMQKFRINDFEGNDYLVRFLFGYTGYYCDKDVDVDKLNLGDILFIKNNLNYTFNISFKDVWMEKNDYKYFMIIQTDNKENNWYFGKPFFKKYQMVFEYDNAKIGLYTKIFESEDKSSYNDNNNKSTIIYILIIIGLSIIIIVLTFFLIKYCKNFPRKKRANELLDDNYDYSDKNINE